MIARLSGVIVELEKDHCVIDVAGVGYAVNMAGNTLSRLTEGERLNIYTEMVVREDSISLFGFATQDEKKCFSILQMVQGVGAKVALAIMDQLFISDVVSAIQLNDMNAFKRVSGIGPKLAQRIVHELKDNKQLGMLNITMREVKAGANDSFASAMEALMSLGFSRAESYKALSDVADNDNLSVEDMLSSALSKLNNI